ncbi:MAG: YtxH domain-containing protein [Elusimicrobia bacterium]|nr:YtxH domain-containing protein [Elusimicrobiota bacterium]
MERKIENESSGTGYLLIGLVAGAVLGLLFAPKEGSETREDVAEFGRRSRDQARRIISGISDKIPGRTKVAAAFGAAKEASRDTMEQVRERAEEVVR